jgi:methyl-accepting chemotaxis protein
MLAIKKEMEALREKLNQSGDEFMKIVSDEGKQTYTSYKDKFESWFQVSEELQKLSLAGKNKEATALSRGKGQTLRLSSSRTLDEIVNLNEKKMQEEADRTDVIYANARNLVLAISIIAILAGLLTAFFIMRAVGQAIDHVIAQLRDNANQVTSAAQQIAASSEQLSQAATEQASSLEETSSSVEEMNSMIKKNSDNAAKAADVSSTTHQSATKGKQVVGEMLKAIGEINESNNQISEIVKVIAEIENKTKVINDIVFKTQLLSFNASVEAARAGAHGKGFAVVAEEVGKLAQLSGNAAREISEMLATSIKKVDVLVATAKEKVKVGTHVAEQCGVVLEEIVTSVGTLTQMAQEISSASQEQAQGVGEVSKAMSQLDQVTQENAATSEEAASAAEELSAQAESLKGVVQVLIQAIKGGDDHQQTSGAYAEGSRQVQTTLTKPLAKVFQIKNAHSKRVSVAHSGDATFNRTAGDDKAVGDDAVGADDPRFKDV